MTKDLDVVLSLIDAGRSVLLATFSESQFYVPPESVIRAEQARSHRGHFNLIHHESGYKADVYLTGSDPLHAWAMERRRRVQWSDDLELWVAPPEYVVLRKMEFFREGGSAKHPADIRAIREVSGVDEAALVPWIEQLGLQEVWRRLA